MRATVRFDDDTAKAVNQLRDELGIGVNEAVNELIRRGLLPRDTIPTFRQRTARLGLNVDVSNVAAALQGLEEATER
jgi:hypothetical protein